MKMSFVLVASLLLSAGCKESSTAMSDGPSRSGKSLYMAETEPDGAMPVGEAKQKTEDGQDITLVGVIGGSSKPFVEGLAAFTIVDPKVEYCAADEGCPTPWDYCCTQNEVKENIATVKIVNDEGKPVTQDAREFLDIKELSTVVVKGKAKRDDQGNLTVAASQLFVRKK